MVDEQCLEIKSEMQNRYRCGERPTASEYLDKYEHLKRDVDNVIELAYEEFCLREDMGESLDHEAFCAQFDSETWRSEMSEQLRYHRMLDEGMDSPGPTIRILNASSSPTIGRAEAKTEEPDGRDLFVRAGRLASKSLATWTLFGIFIPRNSRETYLKPVLAEHANNLSTALAQDETPNRRIRMISWYTIVAAAMVLDCARISLHRRLCDELDWVSGVLTRK